MIEDVATAEGFKSMLTTICLAPEQRLTQYERFLEAKAQDTTRAGFAPTYMPDFLFDFQRALVEWAVQKGRAALFVDTGLGKTAMQLVWAQNVIERTDKPVLILTPLAVSFQTVTEAEKFGIDAQRSRSGKHTGTRCIVTNYEQLSHYTPSDFGGVVCDESGILKSFSGATRKVVTEFMKKVPYRLLCTATPSPNDYIELGTSSEALGELGYIDMLNRFFKNDLNNSAQGRFHGQQVKWRFKGHAQLPFWQWVCSWARAMRKPSDLGFDDTRFVLPQLIERAHQVVSEKKPDGMLFALPAVGLQEEREERRRTLDERCEMAAALVNETSDPAITWCHLNDEGDLLGKLIPDAEQVSGADSDEAKEEKLMRFVRGETRVLVTKPILAGWGLNLQHCAHMTFFPSHSFEQLYQSVRRCHRFGQRRSVIVDMITTEGEQRVLKNLQRKSDQAEKMFTALVREMHAAQSVRRSTHVTQDVALPQWLIRK
jgi:hypothetical protein